MPALLSDGQPIDVRRLKFLEIEDEVEYPDPGLYSHTYIVSGAPQEVCYGLDDYAEIPSRPETPLADARPGSYEAALWEQYNLYRAVLTHERKRQDIREQYLVASARYILRTCVRAEDGARVVTSDDFKVVYRLALCPEVTEEDVVAALATTFQGYVEGRAFMDFGKEAAHVGREFFANPALGTTVDVGVGA